MELETVNKLFLELSQFATAATKNELKLEARLKEAEELLRSAHSIAERHGAETAWTRFAESIKKLGVGSVTARTYKLYENEKP